jgi:3',5'-nucleoside bisphosphate phosphatase
MIDLHTHSTASDGTLRPAVLVEYAHAMGLTAIALTDHDTVGGLDEASEAAERLGIELVPGIELEISAERGVFHLLGLGLRSWREHLAGNLGAVKAFRKSRNVSMLERLRDAGLEAGYDDLERISGHDTVGRPHFAQLLVEKGVADSYQDAFDRFIGDGKPFHETKQTLSLEVATDAIHAAGGTAIVAHPYTLQLGWGALEDRLVEWKALGLDGIEAYHSNCSRATGQRLEVLANRLGMVVSSGSDYHGPHRSDRRLGRASDGEPIDDRFLAPFTEAN